MSCPTDASAAGTNAVTLIGAYLQATNDADHDALRRLVTAGFELVRGKHPVSGIENVMRYAPGARSLLLLRNADQPCRAPWMTSN
jgi:hypothetical protein